MARVTRRRLRSRAFRRWVRGAEAIVARDRGARVARIDWWSWTKTRIAMECRRAAATFGDLRRATDDARDAVLWMQPIRGAVLEVTILDDGAPPPPGPVPTSVARIVSGRYGEVELQTIGEMDGWEP